MYCRLHSYSKFCLDSHSFCVPHSASVACLRQPRLDAVLVMIQHNPLARPDACKRPAQPCTAHTRPLLHSVARPHPLSKRVARICSSSGCSSSTTSSSSSSEACQDEHVHIAAHDVGIDVPSSSCQQLPEQPTIPPMQASSNSSSSATAVSRRSLASITGAALLWGSSGLPAWALKTVGGTCTQSLTDGHARAPDSPPTKHPAAPSCGCGRLSINNATLPARDHRAVAGIYIAKSACLPAAPG